MKNVHWIVDSTNMANFVLVKKMFAKFVKPRFNISASEIKRLAEEFVISINHE